MNVWPIIQTNQCGLHAFRDEGKERQSSGRVSVSMRGEGERRAVVAAAAAAAAATTAIDGEKNESQAHRLTAAHSLGLCCCSLSSLILPSACLSLLVLNSSLDIFLSLYHTLPAAAVVLFSFR